jgi:DNA ligase-4
MLDGSSLLRTPYSDRRYLLESLITLIPGYAMLADRTVIELAGPGGRASGENDLRNAFAKLIAQYEEGAVLKEDRGAYNDWRSPWVKVCIELQYMFQEN